MIANKSLAEISGWMFASTGVLFCLMSFYDPAFDFVNSLLITNATPGGITAKLYAHVMGSVIIGYGVTVALVSKAIKFAPLQIANAMLVGVWCWFIFDTVGSLLHGSWQNAIFNLIGWVLLIPPLWLLKKSMRST